jgi:hypothetical protein
VGTVVGPVMATKCCQLVIIRNERLQMLTLLRVVRQREEGPCTGSTVGLE